MSRKTFRDVPFETLQGETIVALAGAAPGSDEITITTASGRTFRMKHYQDCCEEVSVEEVVGDVNAIVGHRLLLARMDTHREGKSYSDTWTFYHLATVKGTVTLRWLGSSNGYYSEEVSFGEEVAG